MEKCKGCEREIFWGKTADGKTVPLDSIAPVYMLSDPLTGAAKRVLNCYVIHFATCREANQFSRKNSSVPGK